MKLSDYSTQEFIAAVARFDGIPRYELIKALKELRDRYGIELGCKLTTTTEALINELKEQAWATNAPGSYLEEWLLTFLPFKPKAKPFNAHVEMWSLLARASEILMGVVTLDHPEDYQGHIQHLSSRLGKFIYYNLHYRFQQWENDKITDDLETAKELQASGDYHIARKYLTYPWKSFYVPTLDLFFSPYMMACQKTINHFG